MKVAYKTIRFNTSSRALIAHCEAIIDDYMGQGLRLTLRQLYYQLVSRNVIQNRERSYKNLGVLVSNARLAGILDWDAIEDRVRVPRIPTEFENLGELADAAVSSYRLPRWRGQKNYAELWVEKDALAGVLSPLAREFHVPLMVNRGYSSQTAMRESAMRFLDNALYQDKNDKTRPRSLFLFYLGDHDPSGEDMVRDIRDRMSMFGVGSLRVNKLALTMEQVEEYNPPPNPAKMTDPRAADYVAEHGNESWEVDALPPNVLAQLIRDAFRRVIDRRLMNEVIAKEDVDKVSLTRAVKRLRKKRAS